MFLLESGPDCGDSEACLNELPRFDPSPATGNIEGATFHYCCRCVSLAFFSFC